ncbi:hypothetical protein [Nocardioides sp. Soil805]|uniref:hypothetical protein n=1 Tax=Nocardioides sp. Soil805 TaxID=1736416 RepID=UPI000AB944CE|nr:hypothetical protein [Nocardioides sp. Soil805]
MTQRPPSPAPLVTAASLAALEGVVILALAVLEVASLTGGRLTMGLTTTLFFAAYGGFLLVCAWAITHGGAWARGPILLAQLIQLGLAWNLRGGATTVLSLGIGIVALVVIAGIIHPRSIEALESQR